MEACQMAETAAIQATNALVQVHHWTQDFPRYLKFRIHEWEGKLESVHAVFALDATISNIKRMKESALALKGHLITWQEMVRNISKSLASIHHTLEGFEDPALCRLSMKVEWAEVMRYSKNLLAFVDLNSF
ncbi:hypothetical protein N7508_009473 [Penicillium antarcticum]|nr:uncharacterized protein N7508_009473 [Penicillium antarcticum]KAJ5294652.1 hypothetical protein N7508_009473 [Penicillium antarcticum]